VEGIKPPPPQPWVKGVQPGYRCFHATVEVCQDDENNVYSSHYLSEDEDAHICDSLGSKGLEQLGFGLLTEALRREALIEMLIRLSADETFIEQYMAGDEESQTKAKMEFSVDMSKMLEKIMFNMVPSITEEIFYMMVENHKTPNNTGD
jgi:hypothetical protein